MPLPVAHRAYLVAVAFKAISVSDEAREGVDGCQTEKWCRVGMEMAAAPEDKRRFATVLARVSLAAGKWEAAKAAASLMKPTADRWILAVLTATEAIENSAPETPEAAAAEEAEMSLMLRDLLSNLVNAPPMPMVNVAKRVVAVVDALYSGRVAVAFLDSAATKAIHYKRPKSGKFLVFNLSYRSVENASRKIQISSGKKQDFQCKTTY